MPFRDISFQDLLGHPLGQSVLDVLLIAIVVFALVRLAQWVAQRTIDDAEQFYRTRKLIGRTGGVVGFLLVVSVFAIDVGDIFTVLTLIGAGLAIAMREALLSIVGWLQIILRAPFKQGDRIEINRLQGDVVDIRLFYTTLMETGGWVQADQSTGRLVHFPNNWLYQHALYNYTRGFGFIWNEIPVTVTFRSDHEAAREIMLELASESAEIMEQQAAQALRRLSREYLVHYSILTPFVYVQITKDGVRLTLRYLCEVRKRRGTAHALTLGFLERFRAHGGIELAYPMTDAKVFDTPQFGPEDGPAFGANARPEPRRERND